jgi:hypothetical protein
MSLKSCRATARFKHRRISRTLLPSDLRRRRGVWGGLSAGGHGNQRGGQGQRQQPKAQAASEHPRLRCLGDLLGGQHASRQADRSLGHARSSQFGVLADRHDRDRGGLGACPWLAAAASGWSRSRPRRWQPESAGTPPRWEPVGWQGAQGATIRPTTGRPDWWQRPVRVRLARCSPRRSAGPCPAAMGTGGRTRTPNCCLQDRSGSSTACWRVLSLLLGRVGRPASAL